MMHYTRLLITAILLTSATQTYAAKPLRECAPLSTIAAAKFTHAIASDPRHLDENNMWILTTDPYEYKNNSWQVWFGFIIENVKTEAEAITKGQAYFKNVVTLYEPIMVEDDDYQSVCKYGLVNNAYDVLAFSPPQTNPR